MQHIYIYIIYIYNIYIYIYIYDRNGINKAIIIYTTPSFMFPQFSNIYIYIYIIYIHIYIERERCIYTCCDTNV